MAGLRTLFACGIVLALCTAQIQAGGGTCTFQFIKALTTPGKVTVFYDSTPSNDVRYLNITCNIDGGTFKPCPNGTYFDVNPTGSYEIQFMANCDTYYYNGITENDLGPFPVNVPGPCPSMAAILDLKRMPIFDQWKNERFFWEVEAEGDVEVMCQINAEPMFPCSSPFDVNQTLYSSLCSKRHRFTVAAMCEGNTLNQDTASTRLFNGIACSGSPCQDISFSATPTIASLTEDGGNSIIVPDFATSVDSFCRCKELNSRRLRKCSSGSPVMVKGTEGVFIINCEARNFCNTIIRHYLPFP